MGGFRRAQLRGSDELFRTTSGEDGAVATAPVPVAVVSPVVPHAPEPDRRSVRLSSEEIELLADAVQHMKFPNRPPARPSVDEFETLEELRQRLLDAR